MNGGWRERAACARTDPDIFYPIKGGSADPAKRVCAWCPVRADCLAWALAHGETAGIWGGLSYNERRRLMQVAA